MRLLPHSMHPVWAGSAPRAGEETGWLISACRGIESSGFQLLQPGRQIIQLHRNPVREFARFFLPALPPARLRLCHL